MVAAATNLPARFAHQLDQLPIRAGERLLVALSGGLDSVCLLHLLRFHSTSHFELHAAHFDHAVRAESDRDAQWVRGLCRAWRVPLHSSRAAVPPRGEEAARGARYAFLHAAAAACRADWILTAHHADDQLETIIFRLARGTGLSGLRGIPERRGRIVRPLLSFRRAELLAHARAARISWRTDESNTSLRFSRNRIRHVLLPALEAAWPDASRRLLRLAALGSGIERLWDALLPALVNAAVEQRSAERVVLARGVLQEYHPQTRARVMRELAHWLSQRLDRVATRAADRFVSSGTSGTSVRLGASLTLHREFDRLILSRSGPAVGRVPDIPVRIDSPAAGRARARIGGSWYDVSWGSPAEPAGASASFDPSALRFPLELRGWRPGDRIRLPYGTKKLKKLLMERRIPRSRRASLPVLAEQGEQGGVLWVAGVAKAAPAPGGLERWHITVNHGESG